MGRAGFRYAQDHHARADAHDLIQLLAHRHDGGRTYLGRLLDGEGRRISWFFRNSMPLTVFD
jgi:hypothetical protein